MLSISISYHHFLVCDDLLGPRLVQISIYDLSPPQYISLSKSTRYFSRFLDLTTLKGNTLLDLICDLNMNHKDLLEPGTRLPITLILDPCIHHFYKDSKVGKNKRSKRTDNLFFMEWYVHVNSG